MYVYNLIVFGFSSQTPRLSILVPAQIHDRTGLSLMTYTGPGSGSSRRRRRRNSVATVAGGAADSFRAGFNESMGGAAMGGLGTCVSCRASTVSETHVPPVSLDACNVGVGATLGAPYVGQGAGAMGSAYGGGPGGGAYGGGMGGAYGSGGMGGAYGGGGAVLSPYAGGGAVGMSTPAVTVIPPQTGAAFAGAAGFGGMAAPQMTAGGMPMQAGVQQPMVSTGASLAQPGLSAVASQIGVPSMAPAMSTGYGTGYGGYGMGYGSGYGAAYGAGYGGGNGAGGAGVGAYGMGGQNVMQVPQGSTVIIQQQPPPVRHHRHRHRRSRSADGGYPRDYAYDRDY